MRSYRWSPGTQTPALEGDQPLKLPIDTSAIAFLCAMPPEPVLDFQTCQTKADDNGEPLYVIRS
jgi:hypothetical protein